MRLLYVLFAMMSAGAVLTALCWWLEIDAVHTAGAWLMVPITAAYGVLLALIVLGLAGAALLAAADAVRSVLRRRLD